MHAKPTAGLVNSLQVFAQATDTVDDVPAATGVPQMPDSTTLYYCMTAGQWYTEGLASGYVRGGVGSFQTMSVQTGIVAHAGGGQGSTTPLTAMNCFVSTVASANDSLLLPPAKPDMEITVINQSEDPMQKVVRDALIVFMSATAQAQAEATKAAQRAGIAHAKANDERAYLGRKPLGAADRVSAAWPGVRSRLLLPVRTHTLSPSRGRWLIWS